MQISAVSEMSVDRTIHTKYIAGKAVETSEWLVYQPEEKGDVVETTVPGIYIQLAPAEKTEENEYDDGSGYVIGYDEKGRVIRVDNYTAENEISSIKCTVYDENDRIFTTLGISYEDGKPSKSSMTQFKYRPDSLDMTIMYAQIWGKAYDSDSVEYTRERPDSEIHVGASGASGTENYIETDILSICERKTRDFEKWTDYSKNGEIVKVDRQDHSKFQEGTVTEHSVTVEYTA